MSSYHALIGWYLVTLINELLSQLLTYPGTKVLIIVEAKTIDDGMHQRCEKILQLHQKEI